MPENEPDQPHEFKLTPGQLNQFQQDVIKNSKLDVGLAPLLSQAVLGAVFPVISTILNRQGLTPRATALIGEISQESGEAPIDVVGKALALYKLALDAHKEGKTIAILDKDLDIDLEIEGFEPRDVMMAREAKETVAGPG